MWGLKSSIRSDSCHQSCNCNFLLKFIHLLDDTALQEGFSSIFHACKCIRQNGCQQNSWSEFFILFLLSWRAGEVAWQLAAMAAMPPAALQSVCSLGARHRLAQMSFQIDTDFFFRYPMAKKFTSFFLLSLFPPFKFFCKRNTKQVVFIPHVSLISISTVFRMFERSRYLFLLSSNPLWKFHKMSDL